MMIGTFVTDTGRLPLCNFYESPDGSPLFVAPFFNTAGPVLEWPPAEHYYQAAKATFAVDAELIRTASSPGLAKKIARERAMNRTDWQRLSGAHDQPAGKHRRGAGRHAPCRPAAAAAAEGLRQAVIAL